MKASESMGVRTTHNRWVRVLFCILISILQVTIISVSAGYAQSQAAAVNLAGRIPDEQGAVIEGATITVINESKNVQRTAQTIIDGSYRQLAIPHGRYKVLIEPH